MTIAEAAPAGLDAKQLEPLAVHSCWQVENQHQLNSYDIAKVRGLELMPVHRVNVPEPLSERRNALGRVLGNSGNWFEGSITYDLAIEGLQNSGSWAEELGYEDISFMAGSLGKLLMKRRLEDFEKQITELNIFTREDPEDLMIRLEARGRGGGHSLFARLSGLLLIKDEKRGYIAGPILTGKTKTGTVPKNHYAFGIYVEKSRSTV